MGRVFLLAVLGMAAQGCTKALWEAHRAHDQTTLLGRAPLAVDRMVEDLARHGLAFRLAPRPEDRLPPRFAEDYSKGYAWVRLREPFKTGFAGKSLALGETRLTPERVEILVKRVEAKGGGLRHCPVLLRIAGRMSGLPLRRVEPVAGGPDLLDDVPDHDLRVSLGLSTAEVVRLVPAAWGPAGAMDYVRWRAVLRDGAPLDDPMAPIRAALEEKSLAPLAGCEVVVRRGRATGDAPTSFFAVPLDLLFCMPSMRIEQVPGALAWTWEGYWRGRTDDAPDPAQVRPSHARPELRAVIEEWKIHNDDTLWTVLLTPVALAGDVALLGLVSWAEGDDSCP